MQKLGNDVQWGFCTISEMYSSLFSCRMDMTAGGEQGENGKGTVDHHVVHKIQMSAGIHRVQEERVLVFIQGAMEGKY